MIHPKLKSVSAVAAEGRVLVYPRPYQRLELSDPDGSTAALLELLAAGSRTVPQLTTELRSRG